MSDPQRRWRLSAERRAELALGAVAVGVLVFVAGLVATVFVKAWPSFAHNGYIKWFLPGGDVDQQLRAIFNSPHDPAHYQYHLRAWPLLWDTILTTGFAVVLGLALSLLSAIFIVEFAPLQLKRVLEPVVRLLAAVPSVIYGLIGILLLAPWIMGRTPKTVGYTRARERRGDDGGPAPSSTKATLRSVAKTG